MNQIVDLSDLRFDSSQVAPSTGTSPLPAGYYGVLIEEAEKKPTAASTPEQPQAYLQLKLRVIRGPYEGRYLFAILNLWNASPSAVEIAYGELSAYSHAVGHIGHIPNTGVLINKPFLVKVSVRPAGVNKQTGASYDESNQIKRIEKWDESKLGGNAAPLTPPPGFAPPGAPPAFTPPQPQAPAFAPPQQPAAGFTPPPAQQPWEQPVQPQQAPPPFAAPPQQQPPAQPAYTPPAQPQAGGVPDWAKGAAAPTQPQQAPPPFAQ